MIVWHFTRPSAYVFLWKLFASLDESRVGLHPPNHPEVSISELAEEAMMVSSPKRVFGAMTRCHMTFSTLTDKEQGVPSGLPAYL